MEKWPVSSQEINLVDDPDLIPELKSKMFMIGVKFMVKVNYIDEIITDPDDYECNYTRQIADFQIRFNTAKYHNTEAWDKVIDICQNNSNAARFLAGKIWDYLKTFQVFSEDPLLGDSICHPSDENDDWHHVFLWEYPSRFGEDGALKFGFDHSSSTSQFKLTTGRNFLQYINLIGNKTRDNDSNANQQESRESIFDHVGADRNEEVLTRYLLSEGFIVSLEPTIFFPQPDVKHHREPDLMVFHKGRAIVIEIDSRYHLVCDKDDPNNGTKKGDPNVKKWNDDRVMDKYFLCNGFPVLRVWYEDVRDSPEKVMTEILQVFESLGGSRMLYK